jgi:hypothetical protein
MIGALWGQPSARLPFFPGSREKYCLNGGMAFAHHHGGGRAGSKKAMMALIAP